jgi:hypothetical protein
MNCGHCFVYERRTVALDCEGRCPECGRYYGDWCDVMAMAVAATNAGTIGDGSANE